MRDQREKGPSRAFLKPDDAAITCVQTVLHGHALMLELVRRDGPRTAFSYAFLTRGIWRPQGTAEAGRGGDVVLLKFATHVVRIEGRTLLPMFAAICAHRAFRILEWNAEQVRDDLPQVRSSLQGLAASVVERITIIEHE